MPGNSQGIVVSIQAKIEGWQSQIKAIQDALKNIKAGTGISKDLTKDLKQVESLVNNLGKNINQRLTSDSQITGFTDKLREVDEIFAHMGQRMTSISFADMDPSYITNNFKDLLTAIEQANNALSSGMTNSFQNAIAESTNLQKAFDKLGIDPSKMGAEELKKLLETKSSGLTEEIAKTNKEIDNLRANAKAAKDTMEEMQKSKIMQITDTKATAKTIVGDTSGLGTRQMNTAALQDLETKINDVILKGGATLEQKLKDKHEQVDKAIKELVNAQTVEEARKKLQEIQDLFASVKAKGDFTKDIKIDRITDEQLTQWIPDPVAVQNKLNEIKSILAEYKIDPSIINKLNMEELIKTGNFDKLADEVDKALKKTQTAAEKDIDKIRQTFDKLKDLADTKQRQVMSDSATKYNIDQGLDKWDDMIQKIQQENAALREEVEKLKAQLAERAIANVKALGGKTVASGAQGIQDSTNAAKAYEAQLGRVKSAEQALGKLQGVVQRWFSIYAVIRMVNNAIHSMIDTIKELDKTITNIAIVTDMSQDDLWKQMPKYTQMARDYASSIAGVYEVSQLYYQQGLEMAEVMSLTEATLKMARISGLGYADATDYMTNAVRSFKMEMSEATTVVDVYSAVAASSATSVTELATAMSKTASSAEAVGSSFQNTTAMMAVMIEATRESPENIGSALKSIISRYGELKKNMTGTDAEGEDYSLNKVDTALQSIGISIHDVNGEFRDFDDVIMELAGKWDTVDKNTQRYIATVMAGNRQQSRFLALVSSSDRLRELADEAANSEDASQLQFLKSLDSIDSKVQQLQTSIQALYTNSGLEQTYKGILDFANRVVTSLDNISNSQGLAGVGAKIASVFTTLATLVTNLFTTIKLKFSVMQAQMTADAKLAVNERVIAEQTAAAETATTEQERVNAHARAEAAMTETTRLENEKRIAEAMKASNWKRNTGMIAATAGLTLTTAAAGMDLNTQRQEKAWLTGIGSALSGIGTGFMMGGWVGTIVGTLTSLPGIIEAIGMSSESVSEKLTRLKTNVTEAQNKAIVSKDELKNLTQYEEKLKELASKQYDSNEDRQAYLDLSNEIANKYPELISYIDEEGNKIVELGEAYANLKQQKEDAYTEDAIAASAARVKAASDAHYRLSEAGIEAPKRQTNAVDETLDFLGAWANNWIQVLPFIENNGNGKIFSQWGSSYDYIANNLAKTGFAESMAQAHKSGYGAGSYWDTMQAVFGKNKVLNLQGSNIEAAFSAAGITADKSMVNTILNQSNVSAQMGKLVDILMEQNASASDINKALSSLYGEQTEINEDLYTYRLQVLSSEKATRGAQKLIEAENKNLYSLTIAQDKYNIDSNLENQFLQYDFQDQWNNISEGLDDDQISAAWEAFALNAEENIDSAIISYTNMINSITDPVILQRLDNMFKNASTYTSNEWQGMFQDAFANGNEKLGEFLQKYYNESVKTASDNFIRSYENLATRYNVKVDSKFEELASNVGREYLSNIISQYEEIFKNKNLNDSQKQLLVNSLENAYLITSNIEDIDKRNQVLSTLNNADLSTQTGIYQAIETIDQLKLGTYGDSITQELRTLASHMSINLVTEFTSFSDTVVKGMSDFEKAISNATKGMDLKAATEMAEKLNKSITDFTYKDGKFFYENLDDIESVYLPQNAEVLEALKTRLDQTKANIKNLTVEQEEIEFINPEMLNDDDYLDAWSGEFEKLGYSVSDVLNYVLGLFDETIMDESGWQQIKSLTKTNFTGGIEADIEQLINNYENKDDLLSAIDRMDLIETEGVNKETLKFYVGQYMDRTEEDLNISFSDWLSKYLDQLYEENKTAIDDYTKDQKARTYLSNGNIQGFLDTALGGREAIIESLNHDQLWDHKTYDEISKEADIRYEDLINRIASGNTSNLPANLQQYAKLIADTYRSTEKSVTDAMFKAVTGGTSTIWANDKNLNVLQQFADKGWLKADTVEKNKEYEFDAEKLKQSETEFKNWIQTANLTAEERAAYLKQYFDIQYPSVKISESTLSLADKSNFTYSDLASYMKELGEKDDADVEKWATEHGLKITENGNFIIESEEQWIQTLEDALAQADPNSPEWRSAKAKLDSANRTRASKQQININKATKDIIDNYNSFTEEQYVALQSAMSESDWNQLSQYITGNAVEGYSIDLADLQDAINNGTLEVTEETKKTLVSAVNSVFDSALDYIGSAAELVSNGTIKESEMSKFTDKMNELRKEGYIGYQGAYTNDNFFEWDEATKTFQLREASYKKYIAAEKKRLAALKYSTEQIDAIIVKEAASNIDINGFLKAENRSVGSQARNKLKDEIKNWLIARGRSVDDASVEWYVQRIENGGYSAIEELERIAQTDGREVSSSETEAAFKSKVTTLLNTMDNLMNLKVNDVVDANTAQILNSFEGFQVDSHGVIISTGDLVKAYESLYNQLKDTNVATTKELNTAYAQVLTIEDQKNSFTKCFWYDL